MIIFKYRLTGVIKKYSRGYWWYTLIKGKWIKNNY